ncbi:MAG: CusA/CzcA family heavy metal efflux RND transporter [Planctomycetota bacterium]
MLNWLINASLRHRLLVIAGALAFVAIGLLSLSRLDIDAFPDTTPVQVQINTVAPALSPEEVEQQITFPVEQAISGLPDLQQVRSISKFGLSQVVVVFADGTNIYFARQLVMERLSTVELPDSLPRPEMGPVSTGLGEVFHYVMTGKEEDLTRLRTLHDWVVRPALRTVPGTAEVNSWGGYEKRYEVRIDPTRLQKHSLTFSEVVEAVGSNNLNVGGGSIASNGAMLLVHGIGRTRSSEEIANIVLSSDAGVPVRVGDVAEVAIGHEVRRGAVTAQGRGEAVLGLGFMLMGENSHTVTHALKEKLEDIKRTLPRGVGVETVYDRTELVDHVISTVRTNLFEGGLLVIAVLFIFLGNLRAGLIVAAAIPLSMLFAFSGMLRFGIAGSLLSLGALDFGLVVDSSVIMVENVVRRIAHRKTGDGRTHAELVRDAALEVRKPTMFGELIIMIVYLPILTLEGVEGKLFRPMALTVIFALLGSLVLSLTLMPVLASLFLPKRMEEREPWIVRVARRAYEPVLRLALGSRVFVVAFAAAVLAGTGMMMRGLGSEFVPRLSEGAIVLNVVRLAGTDLSESIRYNTEMERALLAAFPTEIRHVWSRIGTAEVATDPMGVELTDVFVSLTGRKDWRRASSQAELVELMQREIRDLPGQNVAFTQPIEMRLNEMISGVRSDVAVKLFGDDFDVLVAKAREIEATLRGVTGCVDPSTEQITGQPVLQVKVDQEQIARYGLPAKDVLDIVESIGGKPIGEVLEGQLRFPLVASLPARVAASPEAIGAIELMTPRGERIPLSRLASLTTGEGPATITREWGQRRITVQCNVRGRDVGSFVDEAQRKVREVSLPPGRYRVEWGGQFENLARAQTRLLIVVPAALALILGLLYVSFGSVRLALLVFTGVPLAVTGGVVALWARGMPFSISAGVGFIALSGVAVLNGLVMVTFIRQLRVEGLPLDDAVLEGSLTRLRPVLMTALVAALGFVPMAMATGMGAEVQKPLATVVIGGIVSSCLLTLVVLPVLYRWFEPPLGTSATQKEVP